MKARNERGGASLAIVILAAGLGTRMKSAIPKVLHPLMGKPMAGHVIDAARGIGADRTVVVLGREFERISQALGEAPGVTYAMQREQKGTADALGAALPSLGGFEGTVVVLNGDAPLVTTGTLKSFIGNHRKAKNALSVLSFIARDPASYGRILRDATGAPRAIVERNDATADELAICEVNSGIYAIEPSALRLLDRVRANAKNKEYYLTDIVGLGLDYGMRVGVLPGGEEDEFHGINSRAELARANGILRRRVNSALMARGVTLIDPAAAYIEPSVRIGADTVVHAGVHIEGATTIGKGCTILPHARICDSTIGDGAIIKDSSLIEHSRVGKASEVGPFAHLRPDTVIGNDVRIGNFVEVKKSTVGNGTKAMHLSYLGDASLGRNVNVGAGTITCNYDGVAKHRTVIGDRVFVGSDTQFVAPVSVGAGSYIGAGSTITKDVPPDALSLSRPPQKTIPGWPSARGNKRKRKGS
jgi:bifunctional UDP-N-acetylglucosamine pyrophosphorylase/glucosamine-1-phosphate N-acetyltransferase